MSDPGLSDATAGASEPGGFAADGATSDEDLLDEQWVAEAHRRSRGRLVLLCLLATALVFLAGAQVQRHFGATSSQASTAAGIPGGGAGLPSGGFPSGAGIPGAGGADPGGGSATPGEADQGASGEGAETSAVIGEVVSINKETWIVKDLGGKKHTIRVTSNTTVVRQQRVSPNKVKPGRTVNITGTTEGGNRVNASTITVQ